MKTRHWDTWLIANLMALVPLLTWRMTQVMAGHHAAVKTEATREFLFYALSASSIALVTTYEAAESIWTRVASHFALVLTIGSAIVYGEVLFGETLRAALDYRSAYHLSIALAIGALGTSAHVEKLTHRSAQP